MIDDQRRTADSRSRRLSDCRGAATESTPRAAPRCRARLQRASLSWRRGVRFGLVGRAAEHRQAGGHQVLFAPQGTRLVAFEPRGGEVGRLVHLAEHCRSARSRLGQRSSLLRDGVSRKRIAQCACRRPPSADRRSGADRQISVAGAGACARQRDSALRFETGQRTARCGF